MSSRSNVFEDVSRLAGDAVTALGGVRGDVEVAIKARLERMLADCDLVRREEFEIVRAMAVVAREEQDVLLTRIAALEAKLDAILKTQVGDSKP